MEPDLITISTEWGTMTKHNKHHLIYDAIVALLDIDDNNIVNVDLDIIQRNTIIIKLCINIITTKIKHQCHHAHTSKHQPPTATPVSVVNYLYSGLALLYTQKMQNHKLLLCEL